MDLNLVGAVPHELRTLVDKTYADIVRPGEALDLWHLVEDQIIRATDDCYLARLACLQYVAAHGCATAQLWLGCHLSHYNDPSAPILSTSAAMYYFEKGLLQFLERPKEQWQIQRADLISASSAVWLAHTQSLRNNELVDFAFAQADALLEVANG